MAGKKQSPSKAKFNEFDDEEAESETWEDDAADVDADDALPGNEAGGKSRDWRDVERYREERALRKLIEDEFADFDDLDEKP